MTKQLEPLALARQRYRKGDTSGAEQLCRLVLRDQPGQLKALYLLGVACHELGRTQEALVHFQKILQLCPSSARAHQARGSLLQEQGNLDEAVRSFQEAVRLRPEWVPARISLGMALQTQGMAAEAASCFREVLRLRPTLPEAHMALGAALQAQGELAGAADCYREAVRLDPRSVAAHNNLAALLLKMGRTGEAAETLAAALRLEPDCAEALYNLGTCQYRLGTLLDRAGDHDQAFEHFRHANVLRRRFFHELGKGFDPEANHALIEQLITTCDADYFQRLRGLGRTTERPVFLVGMPQSGAALVERILASHPDVFAAGELREMGRLAGGLPGYPGSLARIDGSAAESLADQYLEKLERQSGPRLRVIDRTPLNFQHLGFIAVLFPRARIIHCVRHPLDVCLACYCHDFSDLAFACDLGELGQYYLDYEALMEHWRKLLPLPMMEVIYEELVEHPEAVTRRLVTFCDLSWNDRCLDQPVPKSSVGRWCHYADHLGPLFESLERSFADPSFSSACEGPISFFTD
jgi:tetratricopeptide (TPR) repeat protein